MGETRAGVGVGLAATIHVMTGPMVSSGTSWGRRRSASLGRPLPWCGSSAGGAHEESVQEEGSTPGRAGPVFHQRGGAGDRLSQGKSRGGVDVDESIVAVRVGEVNVAADCPAL